MNQFAICAFTLTTIASVKAMADTPRVIEPSPVVTEQSGINSWLVEQYDRVSRVVGIDADGFPQVEMLATFATSNSAGSIEIRTYRHAIAWASYELDMLGDKPPSPQGSIGTLDTELVKALQTDMKNGLVAPSALLMTLLKCEIDTNNIMTGCGGFILNAIVCGVKPSKVGCAPIPLTMLACRNSMLQACLDACINPLPPWCR